MKNTKKRTFIIWLFLFVTAIVYGIYLINLFSFYEKNPYAGRVGVECQFFVITHIDYDFSHELDISILNTDSGKVIKVEGLVPKKSPSAFYYQSKNSYYDLWYGPVSECPQPKKIKGMEIVGMSFVITLVTMLVLVLINGLLYSLYKMMRRKE